MINISIVFKFFILGKLRCFSLKDMWILSHHFIDMARKFWTNSIDELNQIQNFKDVLTEGQKILKDFQYSYSHVNFKKHFSIKISKLCNPINFCFNKFNDPQQMIKVLQELITKFDFCWIERKWWRTPMYNHSLWG